MKFGGFIYTVFTIFFLLLYGRSQPVVVPGAGKYFFFLAFLISSYNCGIFALINFPWFKKYPTSVRFCLSSGAGLAIISVMFFAALASGAGTSGTFIFIALAPILLQLVLLLFVAVSGSSNAYLEALKENLFSFGAVSSILEDIFQGFKRSAEKNTLHLLMDMAILSLAAFLLVSSSLPQVARDDLSYNLEMPKRYASEGRLVFSADAHFWGRPQLLQYIYSAFIMFGFETLASTLQVYFLLLTIALVLSHPFESTIFKDVSCFQKKLCSLLLLANPQVIKLASSSGGDFAMTFYFLAAAVSLFDSGCAQMPFEKHSFGGARDARPSDGVQETVCAQMPFEKHSFGGARDARPSDGVQKTVCAQMPFEKHSFGGARDARPSDGVQENGFAVAALLGGAMISLDYQAFLLWPFLFVLFFVARKTSSNKRPLSAKAFFLISLAVFLPHLVKNFCFSGNPFYPYMRYIFPTEKFAYPYLDDYYLYSSTILRSLNWLTWLFKPLCGSVFEISTVLAAPFFAFRLFRKGSPENETGSGFAYLSAGLILYSYLAYVILDVIPSFVVVLPFYYIAAASGFEKVVAPESSSFSVRSCIAVFSGLIVLSINAAPGFVDFVGRAPFRYLAGLETRSDFLEQNLNIWPCVMEFNRVAPRPGATPGMAMLFETRSFYVENKYSVNEVFEPFMVPKSAAAGGGDTSEIDQFPFRTVEEIDGYFRDSGITHLLIGDTAKNFYLKILDKPDRKNLFIKFLGESASELKKKNGYTLYELRRTL